MHERFLQLFRKRTEPEISPDEADQRLRTLTEDYLTGKIELEEYKVEADKLPKLDLVKLASELNFKG